MSSPRLTRSSSRPHGRYNFSVRLKRNGPTYPVIMDFYHPSPEMAIFPLLLEMHQETFTLGDPEEPYRGARFAVTHPDG